MAKRNKGVEAIAETVAVSTVYPALFYPGAVLNFYKGNILGDLFGKMLS